MRKESVVVTLESTQPHLNLSLAIRLLPGGDPLANPAPLEDLRDGEISDLEPIQLLESSEYRYEVEAPSSSVQVEPSELFQPDDSSGKTGRLRAGLMTGVVTVHVLADGNRIGTTRLEVRSRKLNYLSEYQWMLRDIADTFGALLLQAFASSEQRLEVDASKDSESLYQRFAFLKSLLLCEEFSASIERVLHRPHSAALPIEEIRKPTAGLRGGSWLNRAVARSGPRVPWPLKSFISTLPAQILTVRSEETQDTHANRFVKFALTRWRAEVARIFDLLDQREETPAILRGKREAKTTLTFLDELLARELFADIGDLQRLNTNDQVLLHREGYRDISRFFLQSHLAAQLSWRGGESVYGAGKRDVATLYEYWAFVQLARLVAKLSGKEADLKELISESDDGLNLKLTRGQESCFSTTMMRLGRELEVEFWFNRTFSPPRGSSWSFPMRPDFSIRIKPLSDLLAQRAGDVWLHFDAKYSGYEIATNIEGSLKADSVSSDNEKDLLASRSDMLKMHTYRDAIRRSAGAYVLYPGTEKAQLPREYHELLPGLGAFCLRPNSSGEPDGLSEIHRFLDDALSHVASQMTQHERGRYWEVEAYSTQAVANVGSAVSFLARPPADTLVLLGYVKDARHHAWIIESGLYNLRAGDRRGSVGLDGREIASDLLLLYGPKLKFVELRRVVNAPLVMNEKRMKRAGYPNPNGEYICLPVGDRQEVDGVLGVSSIRLMDVLKQGASKDILGKPVVLSWLELNRQIRQSKTI